MVLTLREMLEEEMGKEITDREYSDIASEKGITIPRRTLHFQPLHHGRPGKNNANPTQIGFEASPYRPDLQNRQGTPLNLSFRWHDSKRSTSNFFTQPLAEMGQTSYI